MPEFYCPRWGSEYLDWETFLAKVRDAGYDGIEWGIGRTVSKEELDKVWDLLTAYGLKIIPQHYDTIEAGFEEHRLAYQEWLRRISAYPAEKINSQTGKDYFSFEQNASLIKLAAACVVPVLHETHRAKFAFAAHVTKEYLQKIPGLRLTMDASHWVCVAETYLDDQSEAIRLAIDRTGHIHARVGYLEGPQVSDPRIDEFGVALEKHLMWWDAVVERKNRENKVITITPEFGPHPYMINHPGTGKPISNQWEINEWMMNLLRKRYS